MTWPAIICPVRLYSEKLRDEEKKKDNKKIKAFIETAEDFDPRVIKKRVADKAAGTHG